MPLANTVKTTLLGLLLYVSFFFLPVVRYIFDTNWPAQLLPSFLVTSLWLIPVLLFSGIRNVYAKVVCLVWMAWFVVGSVNILASYFVYGRFYLLDVEYASLVYITFTTIFCAALFVSEKLVSFSHPKDLTTPDCASTLRRDLHFVSRALLVLFSLLWGTSVFLAAGNIPILSGVDIEESMYELSFGPLYGYALVNVLSMFVLLDRLSVAKGAGLKCLYGGLLLVVALVSVMTGKRMMLMVFLGVAFCYLVKIRGRRILGRTSLIVGVIAAGAFYAGLMILRQGANLEGYELVGLQLSIIGVEYRDFVYAINHFSGGDLTGYDWVTSTLAAALNSSLLDLFGLSKQAMLESALGYVSKPLFSGGVFGVRTGLVSELFLAYQFWALIVIALFGFLMAWVCRILTATKGQKRFLFLSIVYTLLVMAVVGQSIDIVGTLTVLLYVWLIVTALEWFLRLVRTPPRLRPHATVGNS